MANQEHITKLIRQYAENTISEEGYAELMAYLGSGGNEEELHDVVDEVWKSMNTLAPYSDEDADRFYTKLIADKRFKKTNSGSVLKLWPRIAAVAAAVALIVLGVYFFNAPSRHLEDTRDLLTSANDIAPGKNGATITLANGKVIQLSDAKSGVVIGNDKLAYNDKTVIQSDPLSSRANAKDLVASTTKGQTYIFTLPDGTKVWLNAASTLTIPSDFSGTESRKVALTGEAYFEVAKNKKRPFIVESNGQEVTVLGTHFNINAYKDEGSIKTTLLEGSVRVASLLSSRANAKDLDSSEPRNDKGARNNIVTLVPNQQSVITGSDRIAVKDVDVNEILAWKNGDFIFSKESLTNIMNSIARWYDVEVAYDPGVDTDQTFSVLVSRNKNISQILRSLEQTGKVKFKIVGGKVYVGK